METQAENTKENVQKEKEVSDKTRKLKQKKCTKEKRPKKTRMPLDERHQKSGMLSNETYCVLTADLLPLRCTV